MAYLKDSLNTADIQSIFASQSLHLWVMQILLVLFVFVVLMLIFALKTSFIIAPNCKIGKEKLIPLLHTQETNESSGENHRYVSITRWQLPDVSITRLVWRSGWDQQLTTQFCDKGCNKRLACIGKREDKDKRYGSFKT